MKSSSMKFSVLMEHSVVSIVRSFWSPRNSPLKNDKTESLRGITSCLRFYGYANYGFSYLVVPTICDATFESDAKL